jgi:hypothetical protein
MIISNNYLFICKICKNKNKHKECGVEKNIIVAQFAIKRFNP